MSDAKDQAADPADPGDPIGDPVEDLTAGEEATTTAELLSNVRQRKLALDTMPDGPRPRDPSRTYKRRKIFIDWHLQVNYVGVYLATITLLVVGFIALNYVFAAVYQRALNIQRTKPFDDETNLVLFLVLNAVFILLLVIGMAVYAIIESHRVAGPALRFRRALHAIHSRDYDFYLQLRQRDYLQDLAEQINGLNNALKAKDIVIADAVLALEGLARQSGDGVSDDLQEVTANLCDVVLPITEEDAAPPASA